MIASRTPPAVPRGSVQFNPQASARFRPVGANGSVHYLPLNPRRSDEWTIIANLQGLVDAYGVTPELRATALGIAPPRRNMDVRSQTGVVFDWVRQKMTYQPDPYGAEFTQTPAVLLADIRARGRAIGDCDDHVVLLGSLLLALGVPVRVAGVKVQGADWYSHVIIMAKLDGEWLDLDPCIKNGPQPVYRDRLVSGL